MTEILIALPGIVFPLLMIANLVSRRRSMRSADARVRASERLIEAQQGLIEAQQGLIEALRKERDTLRELAELRGITIRKLDLAAATSTSA